MRQILGCVDYIHSKGVVHRDIKPSNILLDDKGKNKVRIIGFGVATDCGEGERLTEPAGTVLYMVRLCSQLCCSERRLIGCLVGWSHDRDFSFASLILHRRPQKSWG